MKFWATSDYHLGHANIIKYCNRPFPSLDKMNETIIKRHNERVKPEDVVYFAGDYCFRNSLGGKKGEGVPIRANEYFHKFHGHFIFLKGNHDKANSLNIKNHRIIIDYAKMYIECVHKPDDIIIEDEKYYYPLHLVGHIHEKWQTKEVSNGNKIALCINVGVDVWNFYPVSFDELLSVFYKWIHKHPQKEKIQQWIKHSRNKSRVLYWNTSN